MNGRLQPRFPGRQQAEFPDGAATELMHEADEPDVIRVANEFIVDGLLKACVSTFHRDQARFRSPDPCKALALARSPRGPGCGRGLLQARRPELKKVRDPAQNPS